MTMVPVCRVCLADNLPLYNVKIDILTLIYEKLTNSKYNEVGYPVSMCSICLSVLRKCHKFMETARDSNHVLKQWYNKELECKVLKARPLLSLSTTTIASEEVNNEDKAITISQDIKKEPKDDEEEKEFFVEIEKLDNKETNNFINVNVKPLKYSDSDIDVEDNNVNHSNSDTEPLTNKQWLEDTPQFNDKDASETNLSQGNQDLEKSELKLEIEKYNKICTNQIPSELNHEPTDNVHHTEAFNMTFHQITQDVKPKNTKIVEKVFNCSVCYGSFATTSSLKLHFKRKHTPNIKKEAKTYLCNECTFETTIRYKFLRHVRSHTGFKPFSCLFCAYRCFDKFRMDTHLKIHTGEKTFSCQICDYKCAHKFQLVRHSQIHTDEKLFSCTLCEFKCKTSGYLKKHSKLHSDEKKFSCNLCKSRFFTKSHLKIHIMNHTGEKPFSCNLCEYKTKTTSDLNKHLKSHAGKKPFSCTFCEYRTIHHGDIKRHLRTHTGERPYSCNYCEHKFAQKSQMEVHLMKHTGEKPFQCDLCGSTFTRLGSLKRHTTKIHSANVDLEKYKRKSKKIGEVPTEGDPLSDSQSTD